jgi:hypothetical protein
MSNFVIVGVMICSAYNNTIHSKKVKDCIVDDEIEVRTSNIIELKAFNYRECEYNEKGYDNCKKNVSEGCLLTLNDGCLHPSRYNCEKYR